MNNYKLLNNIFGWLAFAIATTVYLVTMEPTGSFWDCGEFISAALKLEVGHPWRAYVYAYGPHCHLVWQQCRPCQLRTHG
ncbi:MAG: DUF2723 domain-containing protein [Sphingobacteriales bacterium JAD_PAG50586_3]|nr:MAG: DUF2723 domain-containing protein [Sphingobacteriales bacterium JAD_PAG50586_3]